jgi:cytochrome c-type biogenesis protein CcmF
VAQRGRFELWQDGRARRSLEPEKRRYASMPASPLTEAAIASSWLGDVYVSLGDDFGQGAWSVRAYHKPFVTWIWGGCALMALGGLLAALDPRYRQRRRACTTADAFRAA